MRTDWVIFAECVNQKALRWGSSGYTPETLSSAKVLRPRHDGPLPIRASVPAAASEFVFGHPNHGSARQ